MMKATPPRRRWPFLALLAGIVLGVLLLPGVLPNRASAVIPDNGVVCTAGPDFYLRATSGYISTPDGNSVFIWSFANDAAGPGTGQFQYPGPTMCVTEDTTVNVTLTNDLAEPVSILFPGQTDVHIGSLAGPLAQPEFDIGGEVTSLTDSAAPAGSVTYTFVASEPGTYIYESGTEPSKQNQMGLFGALIVRPTMGSGFAYNDSATEFNTGREYLLLFHEIDPDLHHAVEIGAPYDVTQMHLRYWTVNGRSLPDTIAANGAPWLPSQPYGGLIVIEPYDPVGNPLPAIVRIANAGRDNHPFHPHANHVQVIAQDGRLWRGPGGEDLSLERFTRTTGAGQTFDVLFKWTDVEGWDPNANPVPVQIPGLQNLVFMGGTTFYSGSPYLGIQGALPVGVTSFNECGEQYFPWHTHALNEFQNFDEGFGGMGTLLRVNPPGGCP